MNYAQQLAQQYPEAYSKNNTCYKYYTDDGQKIVLIAGRDGVTEEWIAWLKGAHRYEMNMLRRGRSKSEGENYLLSLAIIEEMHMDKCAAIADRNSIIEDNYIANEERLELRSRIVKAIKALSPDQRKLLVAVRLKGMSQTEVAERLGVSKAAISKRMKVIEKKLRMFLDKG